MLPSERAWAQGVTHAGSRFGAVITSPMMVWLILHFGWRVPFFILVRSALSGPRFGFLVSRYSIRTLLGKSG